MNTRQRKIEEFYSNNGKPLKCFECGGDKFQQRNIAVLDTYGPICEFEEFCLACDSTVGYWAYGRWDPNYDHSANNELHRNALFTIEQFLDIPEGMLWLFDRKIIRGE